MENDLPTVPQPLTLLEEQEELDAIIREGTEEPSVVLGSILAATAPPPVSSEERHNELEDKIVREVIREYTKGGMYFAYNFGMSRFSFLLPPISFFRSRILKVRHRS